MDQRVGTVPEERLAMQLKGSPQIPKPERYLNFHPSRNWEFDFAWPEVMLALEIEGYDHRKTQRYASDIHKYNAAALLGWTLLRFTPRQVTECLALETLAEFFAGADMTFVTEWFGQSK